MKPFTKRSFQALVLYKLKLFNSAFLISTVTRKRSSAVKTGSELSEKNRDGKIGSESPVCVVSGFHNID